jgi:hypothetical protein
MGNDGEKKACGIGCVCKWFCCIFCLVLIAVAIIAGLAVGSIYTFSGVFFVISTPPINLLCIFPSIV